METYRPRGHGLQTGGGGPIQGNEYAGTPEKEKESATSKIKRLCMRETGFT